jgi:hypothetical protein
MLIFGFGVVVGVLVGGFAVLFSLYCYAKKLEKKGGV